MKDAVSAACEKLYVKVSEEGTGQRGLADSKLAAKNLVGLAVGASLGMLASLEAIVVDFMHRELVTHGMVSSGYVLLTCQFGGGRCGRFVFWYRSSLVVSLEVLHVWLLVW